MLTIKRLYEAKPFDVVFVNEILGSSNFKNRIMELGVTKGSKIVVKKFAPFGSPIEIFVRGYNLCLGKNEAKNIIIVK